MKKTLTSVIKLFIPKPILIFNRERKNRRLSFSKEGEDLMLDRVFNHKIEGLYVDVGACWPMSKSNTYFFYRKGWSGLLIEPNPDLQGQLAESRPRDLRIQFGVSKIKQHLTYHRFRRPDWNTFSTDLAEQLSSEFPNESLDIITVQTIPLEEILDTHVKDREIDFFSIDAEDYDLQVLESNNFNKYRPRAIIVEIRAISLPELESSEISRFLDSQDYYLYAKTRPNSIFIDKNRPA